MRQVKLVAPCIITGSIGYTLTVLPLGLFLPTDYPQMPGDGYRVLVKAFCGTLVGWLCARDCYRNQSREER